jgi:hypothetical protein
MRIRYAARGQLFKRNESQVMPLFISGMIISDQGQVEQTGAQIWLS